MGTTQKKKIAIFGGSFNPIHLGHLSIAQDVYESLDMEQIIFLPNYQSPFKATDNHLIEHLLEHRVNMINLAIKDKPYFSCSLLEVEQKTISYSYLAIKHFKEIYPDHELFFIIGSDTLREISTWNEINYILKNTVIIVYTRDLRRVTTASFHLIKENKDSFIFFHNLSIINISSAEIRPLIQSEKSIFSLVPSKVYDYIKANQIYLPKG